MVSDITNPFYGEIIKGAEEAVRKAGYALLLSDTSESGRSSARSSSGRWTSSRASCWRARG